MSSLIDLINVSRQFGSQPILRGVDLSIEQGKTLVIIGESGCGKSVTLKLMMNLLEPSTGEVRWWGTPVNQLSQRQMARQRLRIGYLFQMAALFDSLTVFENVAFSLRQNTSFSHSEIEAVVHDRLKDVGLDSAVVGEKKPAELSGGMRKRVGLARALATSPDVMLYDEPTTGLDPIMSDVINELIMRTKERHNMTSIVVTHDMVTVRKVADRIVMLSPLTRLEPDEPQMIFDGTAEDVFASDDRRVSQFVRGEAGDRLRELAAA
ncbi:MAG TPA: ATP-binding cassette domain-containing protein [Planctomicrobium sp.]|nr:ATP-binding cassette domain-containing protein [Planctomicrobium sp.]